MNTMDSSKNKKHLNFLFVAYIVYTLILTLKPFNFSTAHFIYDNKFWKIIIQGFMIEDIVANIILFLPIGFLAGLILFKNGMPLKTIKKLVTFSGLLLSLSIEVGQLFLARVTTISDIISNSLGAYIGVWVALTIDTEKIKNFLATKKSLLLKIVIIYYCILLLMLALPQWLHNFSNWSNDYYLMVGNEGTLNRPWEGTIYELAVYNRIINEDEIIAHYAQGSINMESLKKKERLLALYKFNAENDTIIKNQLATETLDLIPHKSSRIRNTKDYNGLQILWGGLLKSKERASLLTAAIKSKNQLTVELWMQPATLTQAGPARIVSLSADIQHRNFTIGQIDKAISVRVRTLLNGLNGSWCEFTTSNNVLSTNKQHLVATYNRGQIKLFINGAKIAGKCSSATDYLPKILGFGHNLFGKFTFYYIILLPPGLVLYLLRFSL